MWSIWVSGWRLMVADISEVTSFHEKGVWVNYET